MLNSAPTFELITGTVMHPMLNIAIRAARAAGDVITRQMDRLDTITVEQKQHTDFVSEVDRAAEARIVETLLKSYPDHSILAEESGLLGQTNSQYQWIVDPLDGTTNFLHGIPHICVSIGLTFKGKLDQAVVYNPVSQELFTASKGEGAWLNNKRLRVSKVGSLEHALVGSAFPYRDGERLKSYMKTFQTITEQSIGVRRQGAAALDLAFVAAGRTDAFWAPGLSPGDCAAGALIIREAGGLIADFDGGTDWMESGEIVAATPRLLPHMLKVLKARNTES